MSKRSICTSFWDDNYIVDCDPTEKLLFLYLLSNPATNMLGIYEIHERRIAFDTGIDREMVRKLFARLHDAGKASYIDGYVVMYNFSKHQKYNDNMKKSALAYYEDLPDNIKSLSRVQELIKEIDPSYTLGKGLPKGSEPMAKGIEPMAKGSEPFGNIKVEYELEVEVESELEVEGELNLKSRETSSPPPSPMLIIQKSDSVKNIFEREKEKTRAAAAEFHRNKASPFEDLRDKYLASQMVVEQMCMSFSMDEGTLERWLDNFIGFKMKTGERSDGWKNFCTHFNNWLAKQDIDSGPQHYLMEKKSNNGSSKTTQQTAFGVFSDAIG